MLTTTFSKSIYNTKFKNKIKNINHSRSLHSTLRLSAYKKFFGSTLERFLFVCCYCCCCFFLLEGFYVWATCSCQWHSTIFFQTRVGFHKLWALIQLLLVACVYHVFIILYLSSFFCFLFLISCLLRMLRIWESVFYHLTFFTFLFFPRF